MAKQLVNKLELANNRNPQTYGQGVRNFGKFRRAELLQARSSTPWDGR
jgi:hypothetical protein